MVAMDYFKDDSFMKEVRAKGELMRTRLQKMAAPGMEVRGKGMMQGLDTKDGALAKKVVAECFRTGLLIGGCGTDGRVVKLIPPLTISEDDLKQGLGLLENALQGAMEPA
jgi:diaminobutyrate-2-oxoglutarate transaminase